MSAGSFSNRINDQDVVVVVNYSVGVLKQAVTSLWSEKCPQGM